METLIPGFIGLTLFGLITAYLGRLIWLARCSRSWPTVEGTITWSSIREWRTGRGRRRYAPDIRYEYTVMGEQRVGGVVCLGRNGFASRQPALQTVRSLRVGTTVRVHHHPENPKLATLETRSPNSLYFILAITAGMSAAILYGMLAC